MAADYRAWKQREEREWRRFGLVVCTLANINRDKKTKPEPFVIEDFVQFQTEEEEHTQEKEKEAQEGIKAMFMARAKKAE